MNSFVHSSYELQVNLGSLLFTPPPAQPPCQASRAMLSYLVYQRAGRLICLQYRLVEVPGLFALQEV